MSDLISRKALMRHIESEYRQWDESYDVEQILGDIEDFSSAFDLESVIEDFESKLECTKIQLELLNVHADKDSLSAKNDILFFRERAERYEEFLEILKSAANSENGKNGG